MIWSDNDFVMLKMPNLYVMIMLSLCRMIGSVVPIDLVAWLCVSQWTSGCRVCSSSIVYLLCGKYCVFFGCFLGGELGFLWCCDDQILKLLALNPLYDRYFCWNDQTPINVPYVRKRMPGMKTTSTMHIINSMYNAFKINSNNMPVLYFILTNKLIWARARKMRYVHVDKKRYRYSSKHS